MAKPLKQDDALWGEAVDLLIRLQTDPDNPVARRTAERWLARSADHRRIWGAALKLHELSGEALASRAAVAPARPSRRRVLAGGGAALAAGVVGAVALPGAVLRARADIVTDVAERRSTVLPDGTAAELGPDTALKFHFSQGRRQVELLKGMAFFETARSIAPFVAHAGIGLVSTEAGAFELREEAGRVTVAVESGGAEISAGASAQLQPGDWCALANGAVIERGRSARDQIASWRKGLIIADREPLAAVAERIGRWSPAHVTVADARLGNERISGVFDPSAPLAALEAAVAPLGGSARALTPWLIVLTRF